MALKYGLLLGLLVGLMPACWADVTVIYRRSDQAVAAVVIPPQSVTTELQNVLKSELGGAPADYATTTMTDAEWAARQEKVVQVDPQGHATLIDNPVVVDRKTKRASAKAKLKALGLTKPEVDTLFPD